MSQRSVLPIVHIDGFVDDMATLYRSVHTLVHPARAEGFGLTLVEALASGTPLIATRQLASDDFLNSMMYFGVESEKKPCTLFPCRNRTLCVFPDRVKGTWDKCQLLHTVPSWREPDVAELAVRGMAAGELVCFDCRLD